MLKPNHYCEAWHLRMTGLRLEDGVFVASGTSLPVLYEALREEPLRWYSIQHSEPPHLPQDDLWLVAVDAAAPRIAGERPHPGQGPLEAALSHPWQAGVARPPVVEEYCLTDEVRIALGLSNAGVAPGEESRVRCSVSLHEDCYGSVQPVDSALLLRLVRTTLELHAFYLRESVEWHDVPEQLTGLLVRVGELELVSDPLRNSILIDRESQFCRRREGVPAEPPVAQILVRQHHARFELLATPGDTGEVVRS